MCLLGCFFVATDCEKTLFDQLDIRELAAVIRLNGGDVVFGEYEGISQANNRVTHIICESVRKPSVIKVVSENFALI